MRTRYSGALLAIAALTFSAPAAAEPIADAPRIAAAQKLLDAMHYDSLIDRTLDAVVVETQRSIAARLKERLEQPLPDDVMAKIQTIAATHLRRAIVDHRAKLRRGTAVIYARHFTTEELGRLAVIQSDPAMAKMQAELPEITAESMALSRGLVDSAKGGLEEEVKAVMLDYFQHKDDKPPS